MRIKTEIYDEVRGVVKERLSEVCYIMSCISWIDCWVLEVDYLMSLICLTETC